MFMRLLVLLVLVAFASSCTVNANEGLMDMTFNREEPLSKSIVVEVAKGVTEIEFIVEAKFALGSVTVFVHGPGGETQTLALGITDSTQVITVKNPSPGQWTLEVHVDGDSDTVVDGDVHLFVRKK